MFESIRSTLLRKRLKTLRVDIQSLHKDATSAEDSTKSAMLTLGEELAAQATVKNHVADLLKHLPLD